MRIVVASDSFKGSLGAPEVCAAIAAGARRAVPGAEVAEVPMADGGEGTLDCFLSARGGREVELTAADPLGRPVRARYALSGDGRSAVVELAAASGLPLVADVPPDPLRADTAGTGELIADAVRRGARDVLVCVGGSASTDAGDRAAARPRGAVHRRGRRRAAPGRRGAGRARRDRPVGDLRGRPGHPVPRRVRRDQPPGRPGGRGRGVRAAEGRDPRAGAAARRRAHHVRRRPGKQRRAARARPAGRGRHAAAPAAAWSRRSAPSPPAAPSWSRTPPGSRPPSTGPTW